MSEPACKLVHDNRKEPIMADFDRSVVVSDNFVAAIRSIILAAREHAVRSVNFDRVVMYWKVGQRIVEEEQGGSDRAQYGLYLIRGLSERILPEFGSGFSVRQLELARQFYRTYPIANALRSQLNWSQYRLLSRMDDPDKREYYELEAIHNGWNGKELERQVNSGLFERMLLSTDRASVMAVTRRERLPETVSEVIKEPVVLEFLGLERKASYYERDLETALIDNLQNFLLELGNGFSFMARQRRILIEDDEFFVDLVFYNRLLRCFVLVDLKTRKITHEDLGQIQMYVNYFDREEKIAEENPTVGLLLCADKNDTLVRYSLPVNNKTIMASRYQLYLPSESQLLAEMKRGIQAMTERQADSTLDD
jgi:predicted nuclease of restriction endonuclease-like (RecB) superfamily